MKSIQFVILSFHNCLPEISFAKSFFLYISALNRFLKYCTFFNLQKKNVNITQKKKYKTAQYHCLFTFRPNSYTITQILKMNNLQKVGSPRPLKWKFQV